MEERASYISSNGKSFCSSFFIFLWSIIMKFPFLAKPNPSAIFAFVTRTQDRKIVI